MPTSTITGTHAVLTLTPDELQQLESTVEHVEGGGSGTRLLDLFDALLTARALPATPEHFNWSLSGRNTLTINTAAIPN